MRIGAPELLIILLIVLVLFGPQQLPKLSKMFGKSVKNFKEGMKEEDQEEAESVKVEAATAKKAEAVNSENKA